MSKPKNTGIEWLDFVLMLAAAETAAANLKLWRTYHAINKAKREAGYERAVQLSLTGADRRVHERARRVLERGRGGHD
jgi:hypothetical protein